MGTQQLGALDTNFPNPLDIVTGVTGSNSRAWATGYDEVEDGQTLDAALTAYDPFTYSAARLQLMCYNDKMYAYRSCRLPGSISHHIPQQAARSS